MIDQWGNKHYRQIEDNDGSESRAGQNESPKSETPPRNRGFARDLAMFGTLFSEV